MNNFTETILAYALVAAIALGLVWLIDLWVFGSDAPGWFV